MMSSRLPTIASDLHAPGIKNHDLEGPFGIPYRCLLPRGVKNLLVASRARIFAHRRVLVPLALHVDYAGASGRQCRCVGCEYDVDPRGIDIAELQALLLSQGVHLHE